MAYGFSHPGIGRRKAIRVELTHLNTAGLYRLEVEESLEPGEYAFSPEGSNQVFCFQVF